MPDWHSDLEQDIRTDDHVIEVDPESVEFVDKVLRIPYIVQEVTQM
jgi:hypothetical protein